MKFLLNSTHLTVTLAKLAYRSHRMVAWSGVLINTQDLLFIMIQLDK